MSKFFARENDLVRQEITTGPLEGEWVAIRRRISHAQEQALSGSMLAGVREEQAGKPQTLLMDVTGYDIARLLMWVRRWSVTVSGEILDACGGNETDRRYLDRHLNSRWQSGTKPTRDELGELTTEHATQLLELIERHEREVRVEQAVVLDPTPATGSTATTTSSTDEQAPSTTP